MLSQIRLPRSGDDDVPVAGVLELRHGAFDSLARGAALMGVDELTLRADTDLGTDAGARVLRRARRRARRARDDLASWRAALEELSGMAITRRARATRERRASRSLRDGRRLPGARRRDGHARRRIRELADRAVGRRCVEAATGTPDFPGAIWFTTSCTNKCDTTRPAGNASVDMIVIHDTEGGWDASVATLQNDGGKSVHYIVDADGSRVGQFVPETDTTWHAGNYYYNERSVGIEHVGFAANPSGYSDGLYEKRRRW